MTPLPFSLSETPELKSHHGALLEKHTMQRLTKRQKKAEAKTLKMCPKKKQANTLRFMTYKKLGTQVFTLCMNISYKIWS